MKSTTSIKIINSSFFLLPVHGFTSFTPKKSFLFISSSKFQPTFFNLRAKPSRFSVLSYRNSEKSTRDEEESVETESESVVAEDSNDLNRWSVEIGSPSVGFPSLAKLSFNDKAFLLFAFIACTTSMAFTSLVIAAVPTLFAMRRAAISLSKLADTAREELPSTMAAIRLSGMEISDLTLELSDLSQEIADGVNKSAQAVQAAEAGIRQIGSLAREQTMSMIQERASLPIISLQPVVAGAAKKTSRAVGRATRTIMKMISRDQSTENEDDSSIDRLEV